MAQETAPHKPALHQEILAILGIFLSIFLYLSLVSDALNVTGNWCGEIGTLIARALFGFTGWGAYMLPTLLVGISLLQLVPQRSYAKIPQALCGLTGVMLSFCGLVSSLKLSDPSYFDSGGFLGKTLFTLLDSFVGHGGTILFLVLVFVVSLMISTRFSLYWFATATGRQAVKIVAAASRSPKVVKTVVGRGARENRDAREAVKVTAVEPENKSGKLTPVVKVQAVLKNEKQNDEEFATKPIARGDWELPPLSLLNKSSEKEKAVDQDVYLKVSELLEEKLQNFGVSGNVIGISPGPVVTTYEYAPAPGIKINKIVGLADDLALGLKAQSVRVVGSVPGKAALGIEIPNSNRKIVYIRDILGSEKYRANNHKLTIGLGFDVVGNMAMANLAKMPHLLIAGATGAGKSVGINTIIASILYNATPEEVRFLMVDPKRIELSGYEGIPHLLHPVVVDPRLASRALNWAVREMERRYRLLEEAKVKSFDSYNSSHSDKLPFIVVIVDELADLMMVASKDVEAAIARLAQMARAAGIHMIIATQRPSVDVLTGLIKANFPTRISFKVSSKIDSRTILDASGAEHLLGQGDMLFLAPGTSQVKRIHGAYISEEETSSIVEFWRAQGGASYDDAILAEMEREENGSSEEGEEEFDERYDEAVALVMEAGQASISMIQRRLRVGYNRAARMIEVMEKEGLVGPADGAKPREVIARNTYT